MKHHPRALKASLDELYRTYDFEGRMLHDPVEIPRRYAAPEDAEAAGFIAASFAYGRVDLFKPVVERILLPMGERPGQFLKSFDLRRDGRRFGNVRYRFTTNDDILMFILLLSGALQRYGSIEGLFMPHFLSGGGSVRAGITGLVDAFRSALDKCRESRKLKLSGFSHFLPSPRSGSACKRLNLFLRWMVRDRDIDLGLWKNVPKSALVIPLDTHIARVSRCLGFTRRASMDWKTAEEITSALRGIDPEDPLRYDFALCHRGISGICSPANCGDCCFRTEVTGRKRR